VTHVPGVLAVTSDLLWLGKIKSAASQLGVAVHVPATMKDATLMLLDGDTKLVLVDMNHPRLDFVEAIRLVRGTRWEAELFVFGNHVDTAKFERARAAGARHVIANSELDRRLAEILRHAAA
jgi:DNA-binding NarL/FixJ family response regulator